MGPDDLETFCKKLPKIVRPPVHHLCAQEINPRPPGTSCTFVRQYIARMPPRDIPEQEKPEKEALRAMYDPPRPSHRNP